MHITLSKGFKETIRHKIKQPTEFFKSFQIEPSKNFIGFRRPSPNSAAQALFLLLLGMPLGFFFSLKSHGAPVQGTGWKEARGEQWISQTRSPAFTLAIGMSPNLMRHTGSQVCEIPHNLLLQYPNGTCNLCRARESLKALNCWASSWLELLSYYQIWSKTASNIRKKKYLETMKHRHLYVINLVEEQIRSHPSFNGEN